MDPLSITASIITIVQLSCEVVEYLHNVKDAPKECRRCVIEVSNTQTLLISLRYRLEERQPDDAWFNEVRKLKDPGGPLSQYQQALDELRSRIEIQDALQGVRRRLLWRFSKKEVSNILAKIERLKSLISIALENDYLKVIYHHYQRRDILTEYSKLSQEIQKDIGSIRASLPTLEAQAMSVQNVQNLQQYDILMRWLSPIDFSAQQYDIISQRQEGTGQWFLESPKFKSWLQGPDKTLFCFGMPGAGKTIIAAVAIEYLRLAAHSNSVGIAYLFCSYKAHFDQSAPNLFAAMLKQLVSGRADLAGSVQHMYDHHFKRSSKPSLDELTQALRTVCSSYSSTHIIIDALDECPNTDGARSCLIDELRNLQSSSNVRLLSTSRSIPEVVAIFRLDPQLEVRASDEDVSCFIRGQIPRLPNCIQRDENLKSDVQNKIVEAVDGM